MGAWDATSFGNDTANDWACDLEDHDDLSFLESTLQVVLDAGDDYLDSDAACEAIAAAEVVAFLRGHAAPVDAYTEKIAEWVTAHALEAPDSLVKMSLDALDRIQRPPSELPELWEEDPEWIAAMDDLRKRLKMG
ncbi:DUF4259 domain-containing protein [Luteolibacter sp. Populi]|uniref:DUF4259 domain-containing protein n=1 Tax=Luteolibacter sp. Populi TaxID=3230487 RepID=UPI003466FCF8